MYVCTYVCMYVAIDTALSIYVAITVKFNQSAYNVTKEDGIIQLFLVLSSPSSFIEAVQLIDSIGTDNSASGMTCTYVMC